jgi:hypothetical protein
MKLEVELNNPQKLGLLLALLRSLDFVRQVRVAEQGVDSEAEAQEKLQLAQQLRAEATQLQWAALSEQLPDVPELTMEEVVAEVKAVRKLRSQQP